MSVSALMSLFAVPEIRDIVDSLVDSSAERAQLDRTPTRRERIAWKLKLPGWSASTPAVWDDRVFVNVADGDALSIAAVDRSAGTLLWQRSLGGGNRKERKQNLSSPSPVTDGLHVWTITGTGHLAAFQMAGQPLWTRDLPREYGRFGQLWGYASSPLLFDGDEA